MIPATPKRDWQFFTWLTMAAWFFGVVSVGSWLYFADRPTAVILLGSLVATLLTLAYAGAALVIALVPRWLE